MLLPSCDRIARAAAARLGAGVTRGSLAREAEADKEQRQNYTVAPVTDGMMVRVEEVTGQQDGQGARRQLGGTW